MAQANDLMKLPARRVVEMLKRREVSPAELIDAALARMDAGTYGLCTPAGRRIAVARLEAIPWAETCVECKQRVERRR